MTITTGSDGRASWASTLWSTVLKAQDHDSDEGRRALERLASTYWKPLYFYIRRKSRDAETARDLTQGFFAYLLEKDLLQRARPEQGSFRAYLRAIADRFLSDQRDRDQAAKRGGNAPRVSLDFADAETDFAYGPAGAESPEQAYERCWAEETLARVMQRFKIECDERGRPQWHAVLRARFGIKSGGSSYAEVARQLGLSEGDVTNYLHRATERFRELLVDELRQGVSGPGDLEEDLRILRRIF